MFVVLIGSQGLSDAELTLLIHISQTNITLHKTAVVRHPFFQNLTTILQKNTENISQTVYIMTLNSPPRYFRQFYNSSILLVFVYSSHSSGS